MIFVFFIGFNEPNGERPQEAPAVSHRLRGGGDGTGHVTWSPKGRPPERPHQVNLSVLRDRHMMVFQ